jgi:tetratricopeptide (TPR) repeat protein
MTVTEKKISGIFLTFCFFLGSSQYIYSQSIDQIDREAESYFEKKDFSKAIGLWLSILDTDPENDRVQKKIEMIYELKQRKDMELQRSKINYKIARKSLTKLQKDEDMSDSDTEKTLKNTVKRSSIAINSFITAYRIDPKDPVFIDMKEEMRRLEAEVKAEQEKDRLSRALKKKNLRLRKLARDLMSKELYDQALVHWKEILSFLPKDKIAKEGARKCTLAIENRIKFERIRTIMLAGKALFDQKKYNEAKLEFVQVLNIDPENEDARDYIETIDEKLEEIRNYEQTKLQAEDAYVSGVNNLRRNRFEQAREDFESALALISGYKDARQRLESIDRLREEYEKRQKEERLNRINAEFQNGLIALSGGNYKEAIVAFEKTLSLDKENARAIEYIKRAKDAIRQIEEEKVDENSPYFSIIQPIILSGKQLYEKGKYYESRKKWDQVLRLFPKNRIALDYSIKIDIKLKPGSEGRFLIKFMKEGRELLAKRKYRSALRKFELIKSLSPGYPDIDSLIRTAGRASKETAVATVLSGNRKVAISTGDRAELNRRYNLGLTLFKRGGRQNIEKALAQFRYVVQRDPNNVKAIISVNRIESQLRAGAGRRVESTTRLTPEQRAKARKHYYRGINFYSNNNFRSAVSEWRKVLLIDPNHIKAKNNIRKVMAFMSR